MIYLLPIFLCICMDHDGDKWPDYTQVLLERRVAELEAKLATVEDPKAPPPKHVKYVLMHSMPSCPACERWRREDGPAIKKATGWRCEYHLDNPLKPNTSYPYFEVWSEDGTKTEVKEYLTLKYFMEHF